MEKVLKYSVLRYSPNIVTGEAINLGILYSDETRGYHSFRYTHNYDRILKFDDTLSKEELVSILEGIEKEINSDKYKESFDIDSFIKYYINSYYFEKNLSFLYDDLEKGVDDLYAMYLRFDLPKKERPDKNKDLEMISKIISSSGESFKKKKSVHGKFDDKVSYDFILDDRYIKIFDFDGKNLTYCINSAKVWAWNCDHAEKDVYIVFRYSKNEESEKAFKIIESIFKDSKCRFCRIEEFDKTFRKAN